MMKKIFFLGTPQIAVPSLSILAQKFNIVGVGVFPDKKIGRKKITTPCPVKKQAQELQLPIYEISNKFDLNSVTKKLDFDLGIVIAFGLIFPKEVLERKIFINVHFSLLPDYRGASPVQSAILNGDSVSGITFQKMVSELDAGDILFQKKYQIKNTSTRELWDKFSEETAAEFPDFLNNFFTNTINYLPQAHTEATFCSKFSRGDGEIFLEKDSAETIWRKYLAFDPWPGIFIKTEKGRMKLLNISREKTKDSRLLKTKSKNKIFVQRLQREGKNPVLASQFENTELFAE